MALVLRSLPDADDDDAIARLSRESPGWAFEVDPDGALLASQTFGDGGARDLAAGAQLLAFARLAGGKAFGSSTGFRLPDRSVRSPDAAWISPERLAALSADERTKFRRVCPDVVVEILSATDGWPELVRKIESYAANGAVFAIAIDPYDGRTFARGDAPAGLTLDVEAIVRG